ncbi:MAG: tetratricopeptide repeat protein, partial [bacterium]|nr:tetratricopeptide repeat protein [bacterium]
QNWLNLPLATALENLGKIDQAIECLQSILHVPQLRAKAALNLGKLLERAGRIPQALSAFRRAAMFRVPEPPEDIKLAAVSSAANLAEKHGLVDSARRYCQMLLEMQPNNSAIQDRLRRLEQMPL